MSVGNGSRDETRRVTVKLLEEDFDGADASVGITDHRVQVDCLSPAMIRSYAILTPHTATTDSVVAYYGVSISG